MTDRSGLYFVVCLLVLSEITSCENIEKLEKKIQTIEQNRPTIKEEIVEGKVNKFYQIGSNKAYVEYKGKKVESYDK